MSTDGLPKSEGVHVRDGRRYAVPKVVVRDFGIPRYRLFEMLRDEVIRSTAIRRKGSKRCLRLIDLASLEEYLAQNAKGPEVQS